jgi:hypothetical protein
MDRPIASPMRTDATGRPRMRGETPYVYPEAETDNPARWSNECGYFGQASESKPDDAPWYETLVKTTLPAALTIYQQRQITKLQTERMRQGLPPLTSDQVRTVLPPARVDVGLPPDTLRMLMIGAGVLGAALILPRLLK